MNYLKVLVRNNSEIKSVLQVRWQGEREGERRSGGIEIIKNKENPSLEESEIKSVRPVLRDSMR